MPEAGNPALTIRTARSIRDINPDDWHRLAGSNTPFLRHDFLLSLEESGCTTTATGWTPSHVLSE